MTTTTATTTAPAAPPRAGLTRPVTFPRVLRSEWIKLRTLRSSLWAALLTVVVMVGLALMMASLLNTARDEPDMQQGMARDQGLQAIGLTGTTAVVFGYSFAQLVIAVLGALTMTSEHSTGMIRATFAAVPRRLPVLAAKLLVVAAVTAVLVVVALAIAYLATMPILDAAGLSVDWSDGRQVRALAGCVLYLVTVGLLAVGVGALLRHTAGTIFTLVAALFVLPLVFSIVTSVSDAKWAEWVNKLLPSVAGERVISSGTTPATLLEPWTGYAVLAGYTVVVLVAAAVAVRRRDA
jgi:ABC-2 type transport system permease protein